MKQMKMSNQCINDFKKGRIWESEGIGALYEISLEEQEIVNKFEKENPGYKVYHMIHNYFDFGECYSLLYVSTEESEWEEDRQGIEEGYLFAYVENTTDPWCSEFGSIAYKSNIGGLIRLS